MCTNILACVKFNLSLCREIFNLYLEVWYSRHVRQSIIQTKPVENSISLKNLLFSLHKFVYSAL